MAKTLKTSTSSQAVSRAKTSQSLEKVKASQDRGLVFGQKCVASLAKYDPDTQLLKTYQCSFIEDLNVYSATLPKSGTIVNGRLSESEVVPFTIGKRGCGWDTRRQDAENAGELRRSPKHGYWNAEPNVGRVANGIPNRVDRLKGLGNAIVPQVAYEIMRRIKDNA